MQMKLSRHASAIIIFCVASLVSLVNAQGGNESTIYETQFENVTWDATNWVLTTNNLDQGHYQSRGIVANGYIGINVASLGPFFEFDVQVDGDNVQGWPLQNRRQSFATVGGFWDSQPTTNRTNFEWLYQYGGDSVISGIPHWSAIVIDLGGENFLAASTNASTVRNFESSYDFKRGLLSWTYTWSPSGAGSFNVSYQLFTHKLNINQAFVTLNVTAEETTNLTVANVLNGDAAVRSTPAEKGVDAGIIFTSVKPNGVNNVTAFIYAGLNVTGATVRNTQQATWDRPYVGNNESSVATGINVTLEAGQTATFTKFVGIASSDGYASPRDVARDAALNARQVGYSASLETHVQEWRELFPETSVDDYSYPENGTLPDDPLIIESSIIAVVNPYYLLQNTVSANAEAAAGNATINSHSIAVGGLGSDSYAGLIFWDAETFMQPGLVPTFPSTGRSFANYRVERYGQAQANIETAYQSSKNNTNFTSNSAIFPWTSGRYGNCTASGPCWDYQYHLNGDIGQSFSNYWLTSGDTEYFEESLFPIYDSIGYLYSEILVRNGGSWTVENMTDPDEYANHIDNGGFTLASVSNHLNYANQFRSYFNTTPNETWTEQAQNVLFSTDVEANIVLEYPEMNGSTSVKQADIILITYPLSYTGQNYTAERSLSDLDYYAAKQSIDGPAMTWAIFSIIANQVSPSGCSAYTYQQYSYSPYVRAPWFQFSEQLTDNWNDNGGTHPAYPFLTGHGGANQVLLFGYLGLRLIPGFTLHIDPALPPQIPQLRYRTFHWHGHPITAFSNQTHTILSRNASITPAEGASPNSTFATSPIPIIVGGLGSASSANYSLAPNSSITIPNRLYSQLRTTADNLAQCVAATSPDEFLPGQFPIGAVDGAASTKWQPSLANETASLTVSLEPGHRVRALEFDWGQAPPYNYSVYFHNVTLDDPSAADLNATAGNDIVQVVSQRVEITKPYDAQAILEIEAVQANITTFNVSSGGGGSQALYTSRFATLQIWGSLANSSTNATNMFGDGATVAEFNVIVDGLDPDLNAAASGNGSSSSTRKRDLSGRFGQGHGQGQLRDVDMEFLRKLGRVRGRRS
ncbi:hypothetical protein LTR84_004751 [Exophiala bonariae]|uniref:alpha,alpha-trehalase n=1 Tax=Exophiala bonariae TaxID=1690606 RepID=A0AAV9NNF6_9EURO|nr:hypothetical protein LTR84_004751 [Exophiala bonariae]